MIERGDMHAGLALELGQSETLELVTFVGSRGEFHCPNMMGARVCCDRMLTGLPNASGKVEARDLMRDPVPIEDQLMEKSFKIRISIHAEGSRWLVVNTHASILNSFFVSLFVSFVERCNANRGEPLFEVPERCGLLTSSVAAFFPFTTEDDTVPFSFMIFG